MTKKHNDHEDGHQEHDPAHPHGHGHEHQHAQDPAGDGPVGDEAALRAELEAKDKELTELKDKYLRALADFENGRKRLRQQSEESAKLQKEAVLRDVLPIVDNLERALEAARGKSDANTIIQGVEMVVRSLLDFLRIHGVTPVAAVGQSFDPNLHEAVDHVESDSHAPNTIVAEFHRGYQIGDRTLRPARVSVAKGKGSNGGSTERNPGED
ncbi:MAG TPA: nucleotide exchange factor GrpE [Candidatus Binataceae bacterium]|nr:nucleotide exchange factor GrpE [Candidatus Binataceae bacterium]